MADSPDIPDKPKKEWPDGRERVCSGSVVEVKKDSRHWGRPLTVHETPVEVHKIMVKAKPKAMIELHHHADPNTPVYVRNNNIISIDVRWELVEDDD